MNAPSPVILAEVFQIQGKQLSKGIEFSSET
jgi:hypothetical protein